MLENLGAIVRQMFIELDRGTAAREHLSEALLAIDQPLIPQIVTLHLDQIKSDQRRVMITATAPQPQRAVKDVA